MWKKRQSTCRITNNALPGEHQRKHFRFHHQHPQIDGRL
jgi:hypothetical protein